MNKKVIPLSIAALLVLFSCGKKEDRAYMGSRSCKECHEHFYELWETSFHGRAMMDFSLSFAKEHLSDCDTFIVSGEDAYKYVLRNNTGYVLERSSGRAYPIRHVMGGKYLFYFLTPLDKGKLQTLPLGYDVGKQEWFDITGSNVRVHQNIDDEALPWTDRRYTFNTACFSCHVSQLSTEYNIEQDSYRTTWLESGINCETCHGSAEKHNSVFIEAAQKGTVPDSTYIPVYTQERGYSAEIVNATCAYCHAKAIPLTSEYVPGEDFFQHYDLVGPEHHDFYPDGRDLGENYTYTTWLMSPCVRNSDMDCLHCHTSSGRFRQKDDPNASCLPCHAQRVENASAHTHHPADSPGNICINCHMPKTSFARMDRSHHSMRPPVPAATRAYGSPNACNACHTTESPAWAESFIREHFSGEFQDEIMQYARDLDQLRRANPEHLDDILADLLQPMDEVTLSALIRSLRNIHDERLVASLLPFLSHASPLVRSSAAMVLGDYENSSVSEALCRATGDPVRLVRIRAAGELLNIPATAIPETYHAQVSAAIDEYKASLIAFPDQEISHFNLGHFHESRQDDHQAMNDYRRALKLRPDMTEAAINLGMLYYRQSRPDSALFYFQQALRHDPGNPDANLNLGLLFNELGYRDDAVQAFEASYQIKPSAVAAYNLAILYADRLANKSLDYARSAYEQATDDPKYVYTYAFYLNENGSAQEAINILESALNNGIGSFDIYYLLGTIHKENNDLAAIKDLLKKIDNDALLSESEKRFLKFN